MTKNDKPDRKWLTDFPVELEADDSVTRRDLLRFLLLVSGGLAAGNAFVLAKSAAERPAVHRTLEVCGADSLRPGQWRLFNYPDEQTPAMLIRRLSGEYIAFLQKCPHLACPVAYSPGGDGAPERIACHCHNGRFDIATGKGVAGPPRELRPLRRVVLEIRDGKVMATGLADRETS